MSRYKPIRYKPRLVVAAGLAYLIAGPLSIFILMTILAEWSSHHLLTMFSSLMLMVEGVALIQASTVNVDLALEVAASEGCPVWSDVEKARLRQMSRLHNTLTFAGITFCAIFSFLLTYQLEPVIAMVISNGSLMVGYLMLVYVVPLIVVLMSISLYTQRKYRDIQPILDAAEGGFTKEVFHGLIERENEKKANTKKKRQ